MLTLKSILARYRRTILPRKAIRVQPAANIGPLTITGVYVNNAAGDVGELGHNTDVSVALRSAKVVAGLTEYALQGFDVRGTDITIENCSAAYLPSPPPVPRIDEFLDSGSEPRRLYCYQ